MPATLRASGVTLAYADRPILTDVGLVVAPGDRVGVVGANGAGKSTLLRVLAGLQRPDEGSVQLAPPSGTVGYLPQEPERSDTEDVGSFLARRAGVAAASAELDAASDALAAGEEGADDRYATALERWMALGCADFDARAGALWQELGLPARLLGQTTATLSGGQAARASLAATLLARFDVFLLDEPTNDLDFDGLDRLETFLGGLAAGAVVVSHDRAFLDRTITAVLELDGHTHEARLFGGGWAAYLDERATARRHAEEAYDEFAGRREALQSRARSQREWAVTGVRTAKKRPRDGDRAQRGFFVNRTEKQASKVRHTERALQRLERQAVDKPWEPWELRFSIAAAPRSGAVTSRLQGAVVRRGDFTLGPIDLEVGWGERVAVLGPNGSGKSTLLACLLGRLPLDAGTAWLGPGVVVGEVDQTRTALSGGGALLDRFCEASGLRAQGDARTLLAKFGLGADHVQRPAASLSPGERTRAVLAVLQARGVNCLVLDEPTNHLDLPAIEQLESALESFPGTVLLVTHDRQLLDAVRIDRTVDLGAPGR